MVSPSFGWWLRMSREIRFPAAAIAALNQGNRLEAIKLVREANHGVDLRGAMEAVDAHASGRQRFPVDAHAAPAVLPFNGLPTEAIAAISRGQLIEAIKIVRQATGLGLKEAKDLVDSHRNGTTTMPARDDALRAKLEGIARKHGIQLPEAAVLAMEQGDIRKGLGMIGKAKDIKLERSLGMAASNGARSLATVSREANRFGWLWALLLLGAIAAAWFWMAR